VLDCYDVSVQPQTRPRPSLILVPLQPHLCLATLPVCGLHTQATRPLSLCHYFPIGSVLLSVCLLWCLLLSVGHTGQLIVSIMYIGAMSRGGERSSWFSRPLTHCASLTPYIMNIAVNPKDTLVPMLLPALTAPSKSVGTIGSHEKYSVSLVEYYHANDKPYIRSIKIQDYASKPSRDIHLTSPSPCGHILRFRSSQHAAHSPSPTA